MVDDRNGQVPTVKCQEVMKIILLGGYLISQQNSGLKKNDVSKVCKTAAGNAVHWQKSFAES